MDCAQIEHWRRSPWCVDDTYAYALDQGILTSQATVEAKAAGHHSWYQLWQEFNLEEQ